METALTFFFRDPLEIKKKTKKNKECVVCGVSYVACVGSDVSWTTGGQSEARVQRIRLHQPSC